MTKYIELKGGLGNQLFQYFAGQYIARECKEDLVYFLPDDRIHKIHNESTILDLELPTCTQTYFKEAEAKYLLNQRIIEWVSRKSEMSRRVLNRCTTTFISGVVGYDHSLQSHLSSRRFKGYFQTFRYVTDVELKIGKSIFLKSPSSQFQIYLNDIREKSPIVMHIRGGDYNSLSKSMGLLGTDYYKKAFLLATAELIDAPIWVFSDDIKSAMRIINELDVKIDRLILPDSGLSAAETLILMAKGQTKIIANSTFSWWAAFIGDQLQTVIAPNPWNRANEIPEYLIPPPWKTVDSAWQD
jgi:hypothetical protein